MDLSKRAALAARALLVSAFCSAAAADEFAGFTRTEVPRPAETYVTLVGGDVLGFDGTTLRLYDAAATPLLDLATLPPDPAYPIPFPSFVVVSPDGATALVGRTACDGTFTDCGFGDLWSVDLATGTAFLESDALPYVFDAAFADATTAYVNAKTCGSACPHTTVHRVVLGSTGPQVVVDVPGVSGPVAVDASGSLLVGTVAPGFPPAPASSEVLSFSAATLAGRLPLSPTDALLVADDLEGAADLAVDPRTGDVFLAANRFVADATGTDVSINRVHLLRGADAPVVFEGEPGWTLSNLEVVAGDGVSRLFPFQEPAGGTLRFRASEFVTFGSVVREYVPARSVLDASAVGGTATLTITGGSPNDVALFLYGPASALLAAEVPLAFPAFSHVPFLAGIDLTLVTFDPLGVLVDATGAATRVYSVPPSLPAGTFAAQAFFLDPTTGPVATTTVAIL